MAAGPDDTPDDTAGEGRARSLQEMLARMPQARSQRGGRDPVDTDAIDAPLRTNREFRGGAMPEPIAPRAVSAETIARPAAPVNEPEVERRVRGRLLPSRAASLSTGRLIWFLVAFIAPVVLGSIYLFFIMPDEYVTEFRFSVRVPVGNPQSLNQQASGSSYSALFGGNPTPGTDLLDNFTVADYARSAQAARDVNGQLNLKSLFSKPADPLSHLGDNVSQEKLGRYWKSMVYSDYDVTTGLAVVRVRAYTAQDSLNIANVLLKLSNQLVNDIGNQSQADTVRFANEQVKRASDQVFALQRQMAALAKHTGVTSPSIGVIDSQNQISVHTRTTIAEITQEIEVLERELHNPNAPQIAVLREELAANQKALDASVGTANQEATNLFANLSAQLNNYRTVLANAQASLSDSLAAQTAQRLYLTTYVRPTLPESPTAPDRWMDLLLLIAVAAMVWMVGMLVRNSILEHGL
jgi:capsular polysaccharide transport system permease protein